MGLHSVSMPLEIKVTAKEITNCARAFTERMRIFQKIPQLKTGLSFHVQAQEEGVFILWRNDSMGYQALANTLSEQRAVRFSLDPYLIYVAKNKVKHALRTRYYLTTTGNGLVYVDASLGQMFYADYQASKNQTF